MILLPIGVSDMLMFFPPVFMLIAVVVDTGE